MKPSSYRLLTIVSSMVFVIGTIFVYTAFIRGTYEEIQVLRAKRDGAKETLAETEHAIESIKALAQKYESLTDLKDNFSLMLPGDKDLPTAINQLESLAIQKNVSIGSLVVSEIPSRTLLAKRTATAIRPVRAVLVDIKLTGTYDDMKDFLEAIQTNVRLMDVVSVKINGGGVKTDLDHSIVVQTYYQE